jgi:ornithine cyclodeaminase/alanine dehydrogenase
MSQRLKGAGTELYSKRDVERHLQLPAALDVVETTYVEGARGRVLNPAKSTMHIGDDGEWPGRDAFSIGMPAYVDWLDVAGMKWAVATWDTDTEPPISSQILLFDLQRGAFTAILEGMHITGVRTALQSVVGLRHLLAEPPESIGVFGAGFQARFQLRVIDHLVDVGGFRLYDVADGRAADLAADLGPTLAADIDVADTPQAAADAAVVVTVTDSKTPVVRESWLRPGGLVIALGSYRELTDETVLGADRIVVDHTEQCLQRGALSDLARRDELTAGKLDSTIGAVVDDAEDSSVDPDERAVFVPIGLGSLDVALAEHLRTNGMGEGAVRTFDFG